MDAHENRHIATFDVPGAFLHPKMPKMVERVLMKLKGIFVDIMCEPNTEYEDTICYENGGKLLYMNFLRSIYGCIEATML